MKVKSIQIEFERTNTRTDILDGDSNLATIMKFENGAWTANGPILSRYCAMAHEIWQIIRNVAKAAGE